MFCGAFCPEFGTHGKQLPKLIELEKKLTKKAARGRYITNAKRTSVFIPYKAGIPCLFDEKIYPRFEKIIPSDKLRRP